MAGTYPTSPGPIAVDYSITSPTFASVTHSGRIQTRDRAGAGRYQFEFRYGGMSRATFAPLWAFLVSQGGRAGTFQCVNPGISHLGAGTGSPTVTGSHAIADTTIVTGSWGGSGDAVKAGDVIQFGGSGKVYTVTSDATIAAGAATISINPGLVVAVAGGTAVNYTGIEFDMSLLSDFAKISLDHCSIHGGLTVTMTERA